MEFTPDVVVWVGANWQAQADAAAAQPGRGAGLPRSVGSHRPVGLGALGLLLLFGGPALVYLLWYRKGRDKPVARVADYLPEPPDDLAAGLAGTLLDDKADMQDIIATIVDLARRKVISITEDKDRRLLAHWHGLHLSPRGQGRAARRRLSRSWSTACLAHGDEVRLSDLKNKFYTASARHQDRRCMTELIQRGYYRENPEQRPHDSLAVLGTALLVLAVAVGFVGLVMFLVDFTWLPSAPGSACLSRPSH